MSGNVLILSPHCDDVPLSLGGSLLSGFLGPNVEVVVIFSRSKYTRFEAVTVDSPETTALRKQEEERAARAAGYTVRFLDFPEPFVRSGYTSHQEISDPARDPRQEPIWPDVYAAIHQIVMTFEGVIVAPLGCGYHIDHRIVTLCFREAAWQSPNQVIPIFYEDLPYAGWCHSRYIRSLVPQDWRGLPMISLATRSAALEDKLELLRIYDSQLGEEEIQFVAEHWHCRGGSELLWLPALTDTARIAIPDALAQGLQSRISGGATQNRWQRSVARPEHDEARADGRRWRPYESIAQWARGLRARGSKRMGDERR